MSVRRFLITSNIGHVSRYPLLAIEQALEAKGLHGSSSDQSKIVQRLAGAMSARGMVRNFYRARTGPVFSALMGFSESQTVPLCYWTELIPYCFDCWSPDWDRWQSFFERHRTRLAFFSAQQSAVHFAEVARGMRSVWLPEATDPARYDPAKPLAARHIDVLELGRRDDNFHSRIEGPLAKEHYLHLFEPVAGQLVFPSFAELREGFSNTKISICFPSSRTNPKRSGHVETVTHRYFESFASGCIVLGSCPQELKELFGYNPVIEVETGNEFYQIESILSNVTCYQPLVDQNYKRLLEVGTWTSRVRTMLEYCDSTFGPEARTRLGA